MKKAEIVHIRNQLDDIYRDYRNVWMTKKHYEKRLKTVRTTNLIFEIVIAVGTSGTIAAWTLWKDPGLEYIWKVIGGIVALITVIKPFLNFPAEIERYTALATTYAGLGMDFQHLIFDIKVNRNIDDTIRGTYKDICEKMKNIGVKEDAPPSAKKLRKICVEVNREIPLDSLWSPK